MCVLEVCLPLLRVEAPPHKFCHHTRGVIGLAAVHGFNAEGSVDLTNFTTLLQAKHAEPDYLYDPREVPSHLRSLPRTHEDLISHEQSPLLSAVDHVFVG